MILKISCILKISMNPIFNYIILTINLKDILKFYWNHLKLAIKKVKATAQMIPKINRSIKIYLHSNV